jgi:large subunit ribosomal protein L23
VREPQTIVQTSLITEKGSLLQEQARQVVFRVRPDANKVEIKKAVEVLFKVKVAKVHTVRYLGKMRRVGQNRGRLPQWKKAYVTLQEGHKIDFYGAV